MPVTCISSKELPKCQQDHSQARRYQEEFADYIEDEITPILAELLPPGLRNSMQRDEKGSIC